MDNEPRHDIMEHAGLSGRDQEHCVVISLVKWTRFGGDMQGRLISRDGRRPDPNLSLQCFPIGPYRGHLDIFSIPSQRHQDISIATVRS